MNIKIKHFFIVFFLIASFTFKSKAEISFIKTPFAIHLYQNNEQPFISLPIHQGFLEAYVTNYKIIDKLGSFKVKQNYFIEKFNRIENIEIIDNNHEISISGILKSRRNQVPFELLFLENQESIIFKLSIENIAINQVKFQFVTNKNEHFFGLGEQFSHVNFKGKKVPMLVEENGIGRGDKKTTFIANLIGAAGNEMATYAPIPFFHTTENRAILLNNTEYCLFDFSNPNYINLTIFSNEISGSIWQADSPKSLLKHYTSKTGRMPILPEFTKGTILGLQGGKEKVEQIISITLEYGNPVTAIWIQDWVGKRQTPIGSRLQWDWRADEIVYPRFKNWCDSLNKEGIKVLGYINPYMVEDRKTADEALENNYIVKDKDGEAYKFKAGGFKAYMVDFTNPEAYEWYKNIIKNEMVQTGLSGWMADFGEWLPFDAQLYSGIDAATYHNQYSVDWMQLNREAVEEMNRGDIFIFNRSGFTNSNEHSIAFWAGDQTTDFGIHDGLPSAICAYNSSGLSGIAINHSDIGGYTAIGLWPFKVLRDKDVFYRWTEMETFTPIFRTHEGLIPDNMIQFYSDTETQEFFAKMGKIHKDLYPLFKKYNEEASETGLPIIRHPYLEFPNDENTFDLKYQFMVGDTLMVIPVIEANALKVKGYLPHGKWQHFFTNEIFEGGQFYEFEAPYGQPTVFWKLNK